MAFGCAVPLLLTRLYHLGYPCHDLADVIAGLRFAAYPGFFVNEDWDAAGCFYLLVVD